MKKKTVFLLVIGVFSVFLILKLIKPSSQPKPGQAVPDLGRDHVPDSTPASYNSNPPTSGPHSVEWIRPGIYPDPQPDGKLVHSLEHGYIVISYNCDAPETSSIKLVNPALAHLEPELSSSDSSQSATPSATHLEFDQWESDEKCQTLLENLRFVYGKLRLKRLILVPRPNLDVRVALTAWGRIDKLNRYDEERIAKFAKAYHNRGPEQTME